MTNKNNKLPYEQRSSSVAMTDLMMVLLIFLFIIAVRPTIRKLDIDLPGAMESAETESQSPVLQINSDSSFAYQSRSFLNISDLISFIKDEDEIRSIQIAGDRHIGYGYMINVLDQVGHTKKVKNFDLIVDSEIDTVSKNLIEPNQREK